MAKLFETTQIKSMTLANRFVRSATWEGMAANDGICTPKLIGLMKRFAEGGVGLIITGLAFVTREGQGRSLADRERLTMPFFPGSRK